MKNTSTGEHYLQDTLLQFRKYKNMAEKAVEQVSDEQFFTMLDSEANSIAIIMKHMAGNMRSRWTDFLTSDGEKPDRERDREFELEEENDRTHIMELWEDGWSRALSTVERLEADDVPQTITIRGEVHTVLEAINRQVTHYAYHVGQIVFLAKHFAGSEWQSLSIPRGRSKEFEVSRKGKTYGTG